MVAISLAASTGVTLSDWKTYPEPEPVESGGGAVEVDEFPVSSI
jgi:hypothetical protein